MGNHMVSFIQVAEELKTTYNFEESITSTSLDILALYLKGQKILHMEAKTLCEKRLNTIMLPAIVISSICAILNFALNGTTVLHTIALQKALLKKYLSFLFIYENSMLFYK